MPEPAALTWNACQQPLGMLFKESWSLDGDPMVRHDGVAEPIFEETVDLRDMNKPLADRTP